MFDKIWKEFFQCNIIILQLNTRSHCILKHAYDAIEDQTEWLDAKTIKKYYMPTKSMASIREIMRHECQLYKDGNKFVVHRDDIIDLLFSPATAEELKKG